VPPSPRNRRGSITSPGARSCARRPRRWWTTTRRRKRRRRRERTPPRRRRSELDSRAPKGSVCPPPGERSLPSSRPRRDGSVIF
jgi:hypothetical protein